MAMISITTKSSTNVNAAARRAWRACESETMGTLQKGKAGSGGSFKVKRRGSQRGRKVDRRRRGGWLEQECPGSLLILRLNLSARIVNPQNRMSSRSAQVSEKNRSAEPLSLRGL